MAAAIPMSDQLHMVERLKEEQPGAAGCGRHGVQTEPVGHILDNFCLERIPPEQL